MFFLWFYQPMAVTSFAWSELAAMLLVDVFCCTIVYRADILASKRAVYQNSRRLDNVCNKKCSTKKCMAYGCANVCDDATRRAGITFHAYWPLFADYHSVICTRDQFSALSYPDRGGWFWPSTTVCRKTVRIFCNPPSGGAKISLTAVIW